MSKFLVLTILVSALVVFGSRGTSVASPHTEGSEALIKCSTCSMGFTSISATEQHLKSHPSHTVATATNPLIKCTTCGVEFTSQVSLKKHLQENPAHKDGPLIKCSTCGVELTSPDLWKEHLKKHPDHQAL